MYVRVFNAFNEPETLNIVLTTGSGEVTACTKNEFETRDLSFMDVSNRTAVSVGQYIHACDSFNIIINILTTSSTCTATST